MPGPQPQTKLPRCKLGEGPRWDREAGCLTWVDITGEAIHSYTPATHRVARVDTGAQIGFAMLAESGRMIAGLADGVFALDPNTHAHQLLWRPDMHPENRFNDAGCDPRGRLWAGTMHCEASRDRAPTGALYRLGAHGLEAFETAIGIANGLGWGPDGTTMYFAETHRGTVWVYDYDLATGTPTNRRVFAEVPIDIGVPDGLTVDSAGRVHVAIWRGARLNVYAPDGRLEEVIAMPVPSPTSCCFGGADLRTLYITTDGRGVSGEQPGDPLPGFLFALERETPGLPCPRMRMPEGDIR